MRLRVFLFASRQVQGACHKEPARSESTGPTAHSVESPAHESPALLSWCRVAYGTRTRDVPLIQLSLSARLRVQAPTARALKEACIRNFVVAQLLSYSTFPLPDAPLRTHHSSTTELITRRPPRAARQAPSSRRRRPARSRKRPAAGSSLAAARCHQCLARPPPTDRRHRSLPYGR